MEHLVDVKKKVVARIYHIPADQDDPQAVELLRTHKGEFIPAALPINISFAPAHPQHIGKNGRVKL